MSFLALLIDIFKGVISLSCRVSLRSSPSSYQAWGVCLIDWEFVLLCFGPSSPPVKPVSVEPIAVS